MGCPLSLYTVCNVSEYIIWLISDEIKLMPYAPGAVGGVGEGLELEAETSK